MESGIGPSAEHIAGPVDETALKDVSERLYRIKGNIENFRAKWFCMGVWIQVYFLKINIMQAKDSN